MSARLRDVKKHFLGMTDPRLWPLFLRVWGRCVRKTWALGAGLTVVGAVGPSCPSSSAVDW